MKKVTFAAIAVLSLFIAGCSQNEESESSQEESTEQVTTESSSEKSQKEKAWELVDKAKAKSKEENQGEEQYRKATGHVSSVRPLLDQFANSYKQWLDSSQMEVYYLSDRIAVLLPVASSELTNDQLHQTADGLLKIKNDVEKTYKITDKDFTAPPVYVHDKNEVQLAHEENGAMIYDK
ncbi:hypothetical protein KLI59_001100 [Streptococcus parasanguinis]|uniref:hypothetical protein n=1 Tax=Streptococcus parasanguinis TaxID=1318 RepID=UPI001BE9D69F|nr:hypothetical protein [Streptococcus parasanguinis]MBT3138416.1 hypothetical protein [Streptococcus parasanguinis]